MPGAGRQGLHYDVGASMTTEPGNSSIRPRRYGIVHRYWRVAIVVGALLLVVVLLPSPAHRKTSPGAQPFAGAPNHYTSAPNGSPGTTAAGVSCGRDIRQLPLSDYSDYCEDAWHGDNGGRTAHGVTSTTITVTYREASSLVLQILYGLVPSSVVGTNQQAIATMQAYIGVFNKYFELYGRHVVLEPFVGLSDFLLEDTGLDAPQAEADAASAYDRGAFADISLVDSSEVYVSDLARQKVVSLSLYVEPSSWYRQLAPFEYTTGPDCGKEASAAAAVLGETASGLPASDVGPALAGKPGKIGILYPSSGEFPECAQEIVDDLRHSFDIQPAKVAGYSVDLSTLPSQAQTLMADMDSAGVTTIVCSSCDPITPQFLARAAVSEGYFPQWYVEPAFSLAGSDDESFVRLLPSATVAHVIQPGTPPIPKQDQEAFRALELSGLPQHDPSAVAPTYPFIYAQLLMFFDALQNAGPDLTPRSFESGVFSIPGSSPGGEFGQWKEGRGVFDPQAGFSILHWDPKAISVEDGRLGTFVPCAGGLSFDYGSATLRGLLRGHPLDCGVGSSSLPTTTAVSSSSNAASLRP